MNRRLKSLCGLSACWRSLPIAMPTSCSKDPDVAKQKYFASGNRYFEQKKYREAIIEYRNAVNLDPTIRRCSTQAGDQLPSHR